MSEDGGSSRVLQNIGILSQHYSVTAQKTLTWIFTTL